MNKPATRRVRDQLHSTQRRELRREIWARDPRCYFCLREMVLDEATLDHLKPIAKGGTWDKANVVLACYECNHLKGTRRWRYGQRAKHRRYLQRVDRGAS